MEIHTATLYKFWFLVTKSWIGNTIFTKYFAILICHPWEWFFPALTELSTVLWLFVVSFYFIVSFLSLFFFCWSLLFFIICYYFPRHLNMMSFLVFQHFYELNMCRPLQQASWDFIPRIFLPKLAAQISRLCFFSINAWMQKNLCNSKRTNFSHINCQ